jgi:hypothetical protein
MQNKTELIYKIGRTAVVNPLEYRALYITVKAKEGPSDAIYFLWHYESQNRAEDKITTHNVEFNLNGLLDKMRDAKISKDANPKDVILFLEANNIKQAVCRKNSTGNPNVPSSFLITEDEIEAGEMQRNGKTYKIDPELATELRQELKEQKNIEVLRS